MPQSQPVLFAFNPLVSTPAINAGEECPSNSDVAGIGVILSFLLISLVTTVVSIYAAILDNEICDSDDEGWYTIVKGWFERRSNLNRRQKLALDRRREVLDKFIMSLADTQLLTGFSLLVSLYVDLINLTLRDNKVAHSRLVLYLCCLSSSSHLAAIVTLRKYLRKRLVFAKIRMGLITVFGLFIWGTIIYIFVSAKNSPANASIKQSYDTPIIILSFMLFYLYWVTIIQVLAEIKNFIKDMVRFGDSQGRNYYKPARIVVRFILFSSTEAVFIYQIVFFLAALALVLAQKLLEPPKDQKLCGLSDGDNNKWSFGQTLALFVLIQPLFSLMGILHETKEKVTLRQKLAALTRTSEY